MMRSSKMFINHQNANNNDDTHIGGNFSEKINNSHFDKILSDVRTLLQHKNQNNVLNSLVDLITILREQNRILSYRVNDLESKLHPSSQSISRNDQQEINEQELLLDLNLDEQSDEEAISDAFIVKEKVNKKNCNDINGDHPILGIKNLSPLNTQHRQMENSHEKDCLSRTTTAPPQTASPPSSHSISSSTSSLFFKIPNSPKKRHSFERLHSPSSSSHISEDKSNVSKEIMKPNLYHENMNDDPCQVEDCHNINLMDRNVNPDGKTNEKYPSIFAESKKSNDLIESSVSNGCENFGSLSEQTLYNNNVDMDPLVNEEEIPQLFHKYLLPHQITGVKYLLHYQNLILADYMGLGKTLQVAVFLTIYLGRKIEPQNALIICPASVIKHWEREFLQINCWIDENCNSSISNHQINDIHSDFDPIFPICLGTQKSNEHRLQLATKWKKNGGVMICTYDMFRSIIYTPNDYETSDNETLFDILTSPDIVILDEGHKIRHMEAKITKCLRFLNTNKRIVLTGYPLQNNLIEYYTMIDFVKPDFLGSLMNFKYLYVKPVIQGQSAKATDIEKRKARGRAYTLHKKVKPFILRRGIELLRSHLPKKNEILILIKLTPIQAQLMKKYFEIYRDISNMSGSKTNIFWTYSVITMINNHPDILHLYFSKKKKNQEKLGSSKGKKKMQYTQYEGSSEVSNVEKEFEDIDFVMKDLEEQNDDINEEDCAGCIELSVLSSLMETMQQKSKDALERSTKMCILYSIIFQCKMLKDKLVVFSKSLHTLDFVEQSLQKYNENMKSEAGSRKKQISFLRLDGATNLDQRQQYIDKFNDEKQNIDLFLISTRAGGEGINLCSANRVVLLDSNWNPSHDCEACCRVYRFGQKKEVFIYRLVIQGTMEEKVFNKQLKKELLSSWVVDDKRTEMSNHIDEEDKGKRYLFALPPMEAISKVMATPPTFETANENFQNVGSAKIDAVISDDISKRLGIQFANQITSITLHEYLLSNDSVDEIPEEEQQIADREIEWDSIYGKKRVVTKRDVASSNKEQYPSPTKQNHVHSTASDKQMIKNIQTSHNEFLNNQQEKLKELEIEQRRKKIEEEAILKKLHETKDETEEREFIESVGKKRKRQITEIQSHLPVNCDRLTSPETSHDGTQQLRKSTNIDGTDEGDEDKASPSQLVSSSLSLVVQSCNPTTETSEKVKSKHKLLEQEKLLLAARMTDRIKQKLAATKKQQPQNQTTSFPPRKRPSNDGNGPVKKFNPKSGGNLTRYQQNKPQPQANSYEKHGFVRGESSGRKKYSYNQQSNHGNDSYQTDSHHSRNYDAYERDNHPGRHEKKRRKDFNNEYRYRSETHHFNK